MDPIHAMNTVFIILNSFGFKEPRELLDVMRETNTYISGSVALLALHPNTFIPNDIDFYVSSDSGQRFVDYINILGFSEIPPLLSRYTNESVGKSLKFRHISISHNVNIIFSSTSCALQPLVEFHSTLIMNFIAWYGIVCLYPAMTMKKMAFANVVDSDSWRPFEKYRTRGFEIKQDFLQIQREAHYCGSHPHCPRTVRYLHDGHALVHHFPQPLEGGKMGFFHE